MKIRVKICGLRTPEGVRAAVEAGADAVGLVFAMSRRRVEGSHAAALLDEIPSLVTSVGVFRYPTLEEIDEILDLLPLDLLQAEPGRAILGRVPPRRFLPVFHDAEDLVARVVRYRETYGAARPLLLEGPGRGGLGVRPNWTRAAAVAQGGRLILAGGLDPENVGEAIARIHPYGVDVSSGVETEGRKDPERIRAFIDAVRLAEQEMEP